MSKLDESLNMNEVNLKYLTGTGNTSSVFPARSAIWRYSGISFSAAPALQIARDTPRMALAPNLAVEKCCFYSIHYTDN